MTRHDDLTGEEDAETVTIVVNGRGIEIDLAQRSMDKLVKALEPYWKAAATETRYTVTRGGSVKADAKLQRDQERGWDPVVVRAWAAENGVEVPGRGRVPAAVVEQWKAAQ